jgi:hypothetical protein
VNDPANIDPAESYGAPEENDAVVAEEFCEMHPEDGPHQRCTWTDECAYCGVRLRP